MKSREFISIYFADKHDEKQKKRDVTLAFRHDDPLYILCKPLGSTGIKNLLGISSFKELSRKANKDNRSINNFIKNMLRKRLLRDG
jgi:hypothetical protein